MEKTKGGIFMFFDSVKKKIRNKNILWSVISLAVVPISVLLAVNNMLSPDNDWRFGFRFSDVGIPIPGWVVSCMFILVGLIFLYLLISSVKDIFTNKTFNEVLSSAQSIGDISAIESSLENTEKSSLTKGGELRYNNTVLFYMKGTDVSLIPTKKITSIKPIKKEGKGAEFYVEIQCSGKVIKIDTKEKNLLPLANDILTSIRAAQ